MGREVEVRGRHLPGLYRHGVCIVMGDESLNASTYKLVELCGRKEKHKKGDETVRVRLSCCQTMRRSVSVASSGLLDVWQIEMSSLRCRKKQKASSPVCVQGVWTKLPGRSSLRPADRRMRLRCPGRERQGTRIGDIII